MCFLTFPAGFLILTLGDVPCFHKMKVMHNSVLKVNGLLLILKDFRDHWAGFETGNWSSVKPYTNRGERLCPPYHCLYESHLCMYREIIV